VLPNLPPGMQCQILRLQTDKLIQPDALHSTEGLEGESAYVVLRVSKAPGAQGAQPTTP
jgi:hypothetical protein